MRWLFPQPNPANSLCICGTYAPGFGVAVLCVRCILAQAWLMTAASLIAYWIILVVIEVLDDEDSIGKKDLPPHELFYDACISLAGQHRIKAKSNSMRVIQLGWIFVVFLLGAAYEANLTAILTLGMFCAEPCCMAQHKQLWQPCCLQSVTKQLTSRACGPLALVLGPNKSTFVLMATRWLHDVCCGMQG